MKHFAGLILLTAIVGCSGEAYYRRILQNPDDDFSCTILSEETLRKYKGFRTSDFQEIVTVLKPGIHAPAEAMLEIPDTTKVIEIWGKKESTVEAHVDSLCKSRKHVDSPTPSLFQNEPEIVKIVDGGDQANRIDVVFMGDGYQATERQAFFDDIARLTEDMFNGATFRSYLPVFNIWAIYVQSVDSGIGYNGAKNTPFRLYREAGQLRGIFTGNAAYARTVCRLTGTSGCDYPSLIGNDDYYGGLGGEFVISTKSNRTGTVVLRHEMGHNFVNVGEEYDNGQVYSGVNAARTLAAVGWRHWLSEGTAAVEERAIYRLLQYPWADLSTGIRSFTFTSDGAYSRWYLLVSVSAAGEEDSLEFLLDGEVLPWATRGFDDREFYDWRGTNGFTPGQHTFSVRSKTASTNPDIPRMICSITLHEFGSEAQFHLDNNWVSAYPTWDVSRQKTFRPTNAGCLMRNMTSNSFCPICKEGMWYQFLTRISIIDSVAVGVVPNPDGSRPVILNTLKLGQLREPGNEVEDERLEVRWFRAGVEQTDLRDLFEVDAQAGSWTVQVDFKTPDIRNDPQGLTSETEAFNVAP
ncbi:uncharacterized protein LOC110848011 [Folsomia candida]|uniref:IgA Peptidase M64 n=1 Tax=Folsomia candida TaxID=158441 RepID=A0A226EHA7_FOLCA|nr:uncharacterized protein LOC110848011 [Folsomia candida]OXA56829.1 hypothetical protein Fcan01_06617 [Folsomia candida]